MNALGSAFVALFISLFCCGADGDVATVLFFVVFYGERMVELHGGAS